MCKHDVECNRDINEVRDCQKCKRKRLCICQFGYTETQMNKRVQQKLTIVRSKFTQEKLNEFIRNIKADCRFEQCKVCRIKEEERKYLVLKKKREEQAKQLADVESVKFCTVCKKALPLSYFKYKPYITTKLCHVCREKIDIGKGYTKYGEITEIRNRQFANVMNKKFLDGCSTCETFEGLQIYRLKDSTWVNTQTYGYKFLKSNKFLEGDYTSLEADLEHYICLCKKHAKEKQSSIVYSEPVHIVGIKVGKRLVDKVKDAETNEESD